jgi:hypothetical protein
MKHSFFYRFLLSCAALGLAASLHAEPTLAGNKAFAGQSLDADGVKAVLLGKKITIGDARVVIVIAKEGAAQDAFLQSHVAMTTSQFQNHWRRLFMTGGGSAPKIVETEAEACKLVAETAGAVTVADSASAGALVVLAK